MLKQRLIRELLANERKEEHVHRLNLINKRLDNESEELRSQSLGVLHNYFSQGCLMKLQEIESVDYTSQKIFNRRVCITEVQIRSS